jgi:hypothetical protein
MADEITATASPRAEPILDPPVPLIEQFNTRWGSIFMRPPLDKNGTPISGEAELDQAVNPHGGLINYEVYFFPSLGERGEWSNTAVPESRPFT